MQFFWIFPLFSEILALKGAERTADGRPSAVRESTQKTYFLPLAAFFSIQRTQMGPLRKMEE